MPINEKELFIGAFKELWGFGKSEKLSPSDILFLLWKH
jgi:hypothetical protein